MSASEYKCFYIDDWLVTPAEGLLSRGNESARLEPKAMEVLVYFASHPNEVITREELEREVWHGAIIGYDAVTNTIIKLRKALHDKAKQPRFIATIPKKGYQLIASITYARENSNGIKISNIFNESAEKEKIATQSRSINWIRNYTFVGLFLFGFVLLWFLLIFEQAPIVNENKVKNPPSIIVLPFVNLNDDPKQEYLADGITEDIITDLSRLSNMLVISGNTSSTYKNKNVSSEKVGKELNVNFVLRGSIRRLGDEVRVNTQLVNTKTGFNTWAQRYDRKVKDVFIVQDEVTDSIVKALTVKITSQEKYRLAQRATNSLKAYDLFQEGQKLSLLRTKDAYEQARFVYKNAIKLDPEYGRAYGAMAVTYAFEFVGGLSDNPIGNLEQALVLAKKAVLLDNTSPQTYWALSYVHLIRKEFDAAENAVTQAIEIAPNYADGYGLLALIKMYLGQADKAIEINTKAMMLNPYYTWNYLYTHGSAYYLLGDYDAAIASLEEAKNRNQNSLLVNLLLAASYMKAKRKNAAEWMIEEVKSLRPVLTLSEIEKMIRFSKHEIRRDLLDDLRKAGMHD